ncbi:MAG: hypothetical protein NZM11_05920 [Anaerolineales bacterium]|nr:hypothetical protein [Anaerolineales bacterium]
MAPLLVAAPPRFALTQAVLRTLAYADVFDYALRTADVQRFLIAATGSASETEAALEAGVRAGRVMHGNGFYSLCGRDEILKLRPERERHSAELWRHARRWGAAMAGLPFVRMVAVTGALAMNNVASDNDDIDLLVLTVPGRVWLGRALCIGLVRVARRFGVNLCPNYVLSAAALEQSPRNLYIAHELAQMVPLSGFALHARMMAANEWLLGYLPNSGVGGWEWVESRKYPLRGLGERVLSNGLGDWLECWERERKQRKFAREAAHSVAARLDSDHVKGHFNDHGARVLAEYERRLKQYGIED